MKFVKNFLIIDNKPIPGWKLSHNISDGSWCVGEVTVSDLYSDDCTPDRCVHSPC